MPDFAPPPNGPPPREVAVAADRGTMTLSWAGEAALTASAAALRAACRCAHCTRDRALHRFPPSFAGIRIAAVAPVASYAVNIAFSDGHDRGIFPWALLRDVAARDIARPADVTRNDDE